MSQIKIQITDEMIDKMVDSIKLKLTRLHGDAWRGILSEEDIRKRAIQVIEKHADEEEA